MMDEEGFSYRTLTSGASPSKATSSVIMADNDGDEVGKLVRQLRWQDKFFEKEEGLVAVFDFDYEQIAAFNKQTACVGMLAVLFPPITIMAVLTGCFGCYPCFYTQQVDWDVYSQHVAITRDGIKFVKDRRKTMCGLSCTDAGKSSKTVPFDKITDCDVHEPAGATCCCIENVLSTVMVDTASSGGNAGDGGGPRHELQLAGLREPHKFKQLVWAMKRANAKGLAVPLSSVVNTTSAVLASTPPTLAPPSFNTMDRGMSNEETNAILRDIRTELVELNANIKSMKN